MKRWAARMMGGDMARNDDVTWQFIRNSWSQFCQKVQKQTQLSTDLQYTLGEVTSQSLWSRYDRHFVGIAQRHALS